MKNGVEPLDGFVTLESIIQSWLSKVTIVVFIRFVTQVMASGILDCDKNHLNKRSAKRCADKAYGDVRLQKGIN